MGGGGGSGYTSLEDKLRRKYANRVITYASCALISGSSLLCIGINVSNDGLSKQHKDYLTECNQATSTLGDLRDRLGDGNPSHSVYHAFQFPAMSKDSAAKLTDRMKVLENNIKKDIQETIGILEQDSASVTNAINYDNSLRKHNATGNAIAIFGILSYLGFAVASYQQMIKRRKVSYTNVNK